MVNGLGSQVFSYYCGGSTNASMTTASSFESQIQEELQNELAIMYKKLEAQDNLIVDLRRTIEMLCRHSVCLLHMDHEMQITVN